MNYDNSAARLLALLEEGKKKPANHKCKSTWEELLQCSGDDPLLMSRLGKVMELPSQVILSLQESFPEQGDTWNHWVNQVNTAFMVQNLHANWDSFIAHIDIHTITYLKMSASLLEQKTNTKLIAEDDLKGIREKLDSILSEVISSTGSDDVKKYLVRNLRKLIVSIDEYRLTGAFPLLDAVETSIGHAHIDKQYKSFLTDTDLGKQLLETLASIANVVTVAVGIPQLSQTIALLAN